MSKTPYDVTPSFNQLNLAKPILEAVGMQGYETPTPIQAQTIPHALDGKDILGCAQTGTGKTAAFALPLLHRLQQGVGGSRGRKGGGKGMLPRALVLSPTRELALQIAESLATYAQRAKLHTAVIFGGVSQHNQVRALQRGVDSIVATPGRLLDLIGQGYVDLSAIEVFVLDEADHMLDMGFIDPIRKIAAQVPKKRQTMLFSATMPASIRKLAKDLLHKPEEIAVDAVASAATTVEQTLYHVKADLKPQLLRHLLNDKSVKRAVVFTRTKYGADKVARKLDRTRVPAVAIHGNRTQNQRQRALDAFRNGRFRVLVATDVAARGLDVDGITHVFNFNLPEEPEAYVHRIGRTGRAGEEGNAIAFCDPQEKRYLKQIERLTGKKIETLELPAEVAEAHAQEKAKEREAKRAEKRERAAAEEQGETPADKPARKPKTQPRAKPARQRKPSAADDFAADIADQAGIEVDHSAKQQFDDWDDRPARKPRKKTAGKRTSRSDSRGPAKKAGPKKKFAGKKFAGKKAGKKTASRPGKPFAKKTSKKTGKKVGKKMGIKSPRLGGKGGKPTGKPGNRPAPKGKSPRSGQGRARKAKP